MSSTVIPTQAQLEAAEQYALKHMCAGPQSITSQFGPNLTYWDDIQNRCRVGAMGCRASNSSPFSREPYNADGSINNSIENETNPKIKAFWAYKGWLPDYYVWKNVGKNTVKPVCARGNTMLKQWCEFPSTRKAETSGAVAGSGVDDAPPFIYDIRNGHETCYITPEYCRFKGLDFKGIDEQGNPEHCFKSEMDKIFGMFASDVLVDYIKKSE